MTTHAKLSASKTKEWMHCPGQIIVGERFPEEDTPGDAARLGTAAHYLVERCLQEGKLPETFEGRILEILNEGEANEGCSILRPNAKWPDDPMRLVFEIDDDMIEATTAMVSYVADRCVELGLSKKSRSMKVKMASVAGLVAADKVRLETRTNLFPFRDDTGGTADVTIDAAPVLIEIVDYKHGSGIYVPSHENPQLRTYGMGVAQTATDSYIEEDWDVDYDMVRMTIVQPRHHEAPEGGVSFEELSMAEMIQWRDEVLLPAVQAVDHTRMLVDAYEDEMGSPLSYNDLMDFLFQEGQLCMNNKDHKCWFCEGHMDFPAAHQFVAELAAADFADEPIDIEVDDEMSERVVRAMHWTPFIETWLKQIAKLAKAEAMKGVEVPDHKLIRKTTHLKWRDEEGDEDAIILALTEKFEIDREKVVKTRLLTPTQALDLIKKEGDPDAVKSFEEDFAHRPQGDIDLVHKSKKGAPYVPDTAKEDFDDVELDGSEDEDDLWD